MQDALKSLAERKPLRSAHTLLLQYAIAAHHDEIRIQLLDQLPSASVNVCGALHWFGKLTDLSQVWISITAFLHFISQQNEGLPGNNANDPGWLGTFRQLASRRLVLRTLTLMDTANKFAGVLLRDDINTSAPVSPVGKRRFVRYFIG